MIRKLRNKKLLNSNTIALFSLFIGTALTAIASILTTIIIARNTTTEVFGNYSAILASIVTFAPLCGFGISQYWLKLFGQHGSYGILWIKKSLFFISISTILVFLTLITWYYLNSETNYIILVSILLSFVVFKRVCIEITNSILQIDSRFLLLSVWQFFNTSIVLFIILAFVYLFSISLDELKIAAIYFSTVIISLIISIFLILNFIKKHKENIDTKRLLVLRNKYKPKITNIFKESAPFGFAGLFYLIYYQFGVVFVKYIEGAESSAYYAVAFTFLTAALLVPSVIYQKFLLPKLHKWAYHDKEKFIKSYYYGNYIMLILGIFGFLFLWFFAPFFVNLFFGEKYNASIHLVQIMAINIPIVYVASSAGSLLVTQEHMKTKVYYMGISAVISLVLIIPMINNFGTVGAIYTNIICNIFILIIYFYKVRKDILIKDSHLEKKNDR